MNDRFETGKFDILCSILCIENTRWLPLFLKNYSHKIFMLCFEIFNLHDTLDICNKIQISNH
jgi:hypothetical protein